MPRPIHFELPADDPDRAAAFYAEAFGWKVEKWGGPSDYWSVDDAVARVLAAGGRVVRAKSAVPGVGWLAYCLDTEGNPFGVMQDDPTAT